MTRSPVSLRYERALLRAGARLVAGVDEVGRGALCGPVTVGVVVVGPRTPTAPRGVRDSKELSAAVRQELAPRVRRWALDCAVGHAEPVEVDDHGIVAALGLAARRALALLSVAPDAIVLDGAHDYLGASAQTWGVIEAVDGPAAVHTVVRADRSCAAVAAASILAKTERDARMAGLAARFPGYGWHENKGYGTAEHVDALGRLGVTSEHRRSWRLPGRP